MMFFSVFLFGVLVTSTTEGSDENVLNGNETGVLETTKQPQQPSKPDDHFLYFCGKHSNINGTSSWIICPDGHDMFWLTAMLLSFTCGIILGYCFPGKLCGHGEKAEKNLHGSRSLIKV